MIFSDPEGLRDHLDREDQFLIDVLFWLIVHHFRMEAK